MDKGIDQNVILQAIHELSDQIKSVEKNLSERMSELESRMEALETRTASLEEGQKEIKEQVRKIDKKLDILNRSSEE
ncbi:hypothetical protein [Heyndrickxia coagulans]|uniref:Uncharacterized protein n=1 Tax=Heyndrickxia coagulans DSM 1 = ATCC 7050 TaxID=1121088 RepID=A0A8B4BXM2_HEYCO|nr:hypothetical protein [Heyndrickxia coagulans]AJH77203.1 hypothetical protein BF29_1749 [Heyndrickxia coagulans DSM 1 = ATCC 7050]MCR2847459.1 hypothetical protein [Heyndrickxia coagulans]UYM80531.1 hypothetical protein OF848_08585 [Heyndrickxia coagulans]SHF72732.1 hypothetical protein SAMN02745208_02571 [Heyndrickxia coagulans DSM 1 = ATCC 7050]